MCHLYNAPSLDAHGVLVDADGHFVLQDAAGPAADGAQVIGHEERCSHNRPHSHLRPRLFHAEAKVASNQLWRSESHNQEIIFHTCSTFLTNCRAFYLTCTIGAA